MKTLFCSLIMCLPIVLFCSESLILTSAGVVYLAALYWVISRTDAGRRFWREAFRLTGPME